jgi:hypothetical protein
MLIASKSDGDVLMADAQIGGVLNCEEGKFAGLNFQRTAIKRAFFWRGVQRCTSLDLSRASVGSLTDDEKSWGRTDEYHLDGFVYEHILGVDTPRGAETRLDWLNHQKGFAPQSYRQLAKVLHEMGDDDGMRQALFELEGRVRSEERARLLAGHSIKGALDSAGDFLSWATIGYGIHPGWAILESAALASVGWIIFRRAYQLGAMVPSDKGAREAFHKGQAPEQYQPFAPLIYSIENSVPLVKFGQDERWQPNQEPPGKRVAPPSQVRGSFLSFANRILDWVVGRVPAGAITPVTLRWVRWLMIGLGWLFATFLVAGLSGLIKAY